MFGGEDWLRYRKVGRHCGGGGGGKHGQVGLMPMCCSQVVMKVGLSCIAPIVLNHHDNSMAPIT